MRDTGSDFRSQVDAEKSIADLSAEEVIKLRLFARHTLVFGLHELAEDELISEALVRTLDGTRRWNKKLGIVEHLMGVMKSIASDQRRTKRTKVEVLSADPERSNAGESEEACVDESSSLESEQVISAILKIFSDDDHSKLVIQALIEGEKRRETLVKTGMSENEYGAARKRILRKVLQLKEEGQI